MFGATRSWRVTVAALATIAAAVILMLAALVLVGWEFGVVEELCVTLLIGSSIDYCIHLAVAYSESEPPVADEAGSIPPGAAAGGGCGYGQSFGSRDDVIGRGGGGGGDGDDVSVMRGDRQGGFTFAFAHLSSSTHLAKHFFIGISCGYTFAASGHKPVLVAQGKLDRLNAPT